MGYINLNSKGLYKQLVWAVNHLSVGYYNWREGRILELNFSDGVRARLAPDMNAGSVALQYFFAQIYASQEWLAVARHREWFPGAVRAYVRQPLAARPGCRAALPARSDPAAR